MRLIPRPVQTYARDAAGAFEKAPVEVAIGIVLAIVFSVCLRRDADETFMRAVVSAGLSLPLVFGLSVLRARGAISAPARWAGSLAVVAAALAYGQLGFDPDRQTEGWRFASLLGAAVMGVALAAFPGPGDAARRRARVWRFDALLLARIVTVLAYGAALYAALAGAVAAVTSLFELKTPEHLYADLAGAVFFALVPWVVVGGIPELVEEPSEGDAHAPRVLRLLGRYLYAPVLVVYLAILLAYTVKVLATGEAPKNLLSPIILLAGFFGFLGSVLLEPLRRDPEHTGVARLTRIFPALLLVLLPLAVWAVWVRRDQYGWTEFRYLRFLLLLALGVLAVAGVVRLVRRREPLLATVPAVLGVTLLLASFGPWGAGSVSRRSQEGRLRDGLRQAGLLQAGKVERVLVLPDRARSDTLVVPEALYDRITGSVKYLYESHGVEPLRPFFASDLSGFENGWQLAAGLGLRPGCDRAPGVDFASATLPDHLPVPGLPGGTLYRLSAAREKQPASADTGAVRLRVAGMELQVVGREPTGEWVARVDVRPLLARMLAAQLTECGEATRASHLVLSAAEARRPLTDAAGRVRGQLVITYLGIGRKPGAPGRGEGPLSVDNANGLVVVGGE